MVTGFHSDVILLALVKLLLPYVSWAHDENKGNKKKLNITHRLTAIYVISIERNRVKHFKAKSKGKMKTYQTNITFFSNQLLPCRQRSKGIHPLQVVNPHDYKL